MSRLVQVLAAPALLFLFVARAQQPAKPLARFHHVHLNSINPKSAIKFYTTRFDSESRRYSGSQDAVWVQKSWLLFTATKTPPKSEITSAIWHIGWGAEDMKAAYEKQIEAGAKFQTPITDISDQGDGKGGNGRFFFAYFDGPDHVLIELNTADHHRFGHVHLLSNDPIAAGEWYVREFGLIRRGPATPSTDVRYRKGRQVAPAVSLMMDNVNVIIYPAGNAKAAFPGVWKDRQDLESTRGHVIDHIGFRVDSLAATLQRLKKDGINPLQAGPDSAFIEGPDHILLELIEER